MPPPKAEKVCATCQERNPNAKKVQKVWGRPGTVQESCQGGLLEQKFLHRDQESS